MSASRQHAPIGQLLNELRPSARPAVVITARGARLRPVTTATPPAERPRQADAHERSMIASDALGRALAQDWGRR
jgi:hypothetical protein